MTNLIDYNALRTRALANRKPMGSSIIFGNQNLPNAGQGSGTPTFNPQNLQKYKPLFDKYFRPEDVGKIMWTSMWENSSGDPTVISGAGPNPQHGRATGLLQILPQFVSENGVVINPERPTQKELQDPETNIRYAAELVYGKGGKTNPRPAYWGDWQDNPKKGEAIWGALGAHPYPGDVNVNLPTTPLPTDHQARIDSARQAYENAEAIRQVRESEFNSLRTSLAQKRDAEIEKLNTKPKPGQDLYQLNEETKTQKEAIEAKYEAELMQQKTVLTDAANAAQKTSVWYNVLTGLPNLVGDKDTKIFNVDDLEKFLSENSEGINLGGWHPFKNSGKVTFTQEQRDYLDKAIKQLAPYIGGPHNSPATMDQLSAFLAATSSNQVPSHRVSMASMTTDGIKTLLKTQGGTKTPLPPGLTAEKLRAYYASENLLDDETKKAIGDLQGQAKGLVKKWVNQNAAYEAYKLGIADPTNNLPALKQREGNIVQWGLEKLEVYSKNVVRPIAAYGTSGIGFLRDLPFGNALLNAASPGFQLWNDLGILNLSNEDTDQLRAIIRHNRHEGMNWWEAAGNGFDKWEANTLTKMMLETIADPTTYLGTGLYTKVFKPLPVLGKTVAAVEEGFKLGIDNPVVNKALLSLTGAGLGYTISGGSTYGLLAGAGFPLLRHVPIYTPSQLIERTMRSFKDTLFEAAALHSHGNNLAAMSPEEFHDMINLGLQAVKNNPQTAHLIPQGRLVKFMLNHFDPWIENKDIAEWMARAREPVASTSLYAPDSQLRFSTGRAVSNDELLHINRIYDQLLDNPDRGIISLNIAADEIARTLGVSGDFARNAIRDAITERFESNISRITEKLTGETAGDMAVELSQQVKRAGLTNFNHELFYHSQFQGLITGLSRRIDPLTSSKGIRWMAQAQNWYAHSMLKFFNFGPFNYFETHMRAVLGGASWALPIKADEIGNAQLHHAWNSYFPTALREGGSRNIELVPRKAAGESNIPELKKKRGLIKGFMDVAFGKTLDDWEIQKKAAYYDHDVWNTFSQEAPEAYQAVKDLADGIRATFNLQGLDRKEISGRVQDMLNGYLRPDAPEFIRKLKTDVPTANRQKLLTDVYQSIQHYPTLDQLVTDQVLRDVMAGRAVTVDENFERHLDLLLDMPAVKAYRQEQALKEMREQVQKTLAGTSSPVPFNYTSGKVTENPALSFLTDMTGDELFEYNGRYIVLAEMPDGSLQPFYKSSGRAIDSTGATKTAGEWQVFHGFSENPVTINGRDFPAGWFIKTGSDNVGRNSPAFKNIIDRLDEELPGDWFRGQVDPRFQSLVDNASKLSSEDLKHINMESFGRQLDNPEAVINQISRIPEKLAADPIQIPEIYRQVSKEQVGQIMSFLTDAQQVIDESMGELRSTATIRGHRISGDENLATHWNESNAALHSYANSATSEFSQMVESLRNHVKQFFPDQEVQINSLLDNMVERNNLVAQTRQRDIQVFEDFRRENGHAPRTPDEWQEVNAAREKIWDEYRAKQSSFLVQHNTLAEQITPSMGVITDVTHKGLTIPDIATLYTSSGDELAQSLIIGSSIRDKESWTSAVYGTAKGKAGALGKTPEELGWTKDAIGQVYDNLRIRSGIDPAEDSALYVARQELESLRKDVHMHVMNNGYRIEDIDAINNSYEKFAQFAEKNPAPREAVNRTFQKARLHYEHTFTDYTNGNFFDAIMRGIFPFWYYQASRWPYLAEQAFRHPGLVTSFGRFQNYTEKGYSHIPGLDLAFNIARGTILMGGMGGLIQQFPAQYEDGVFGEFAHGIDQMGRAGFYPGLWTTLPLALLKINDFSLSPAIESPLNAYTYITGDQSLQNLRERIFPSKFKLYYQQELASNLSQERQLGLSGHDIKRRIDEGIATEEEKAVWREAGHQLAGYQLMFEQTGILKLDIEAKRQAANEIAKFIEEKTGITKEQQDAITDRLGDSGYRILDLFPLDPASAKQLYEMTRYKYWSGNTAVLNPPEFQKLQNKIDSFWEQVERIQKQTRETGFTDSHGKHVQSLQELEKDFKSGKLPAKEYLKAVSDIKAKQSEQIEALKNDPMYKDVPITLAQREEYRRTHDMPMPVEHPAKELLRLYNELTIENDPITNEPLWDKYFASVDGILNALPAEQRGYLIDFIQKDWTSTQKLYWEINRTFLRPYMNLREGILQAITPEQQSFLRRYENATPAQIKNLSKEEQKLISDYQSAVSNARTKYRQLDPETDAWLFYWGKTSTLQSEAARMKYNAIVKQFQGGTPYLNPVEEKKHLLPSLPSSSNPEFIPNNMGKKNP